MAGGWRYDHLMRVAAGLVPGEEVFRRFGSNSDIDIGTEDVWETGGTRTDPTAAANMVFVSTDAADAAAGTGARTISVRYLDADYLSQTTTVTLNGITSVDSGIPAIRVIRMSVVTAGSGDANAGVISCTVGGNTQASIAVGVNQTLMSHFTVPADKKAVLFRYKGSQSGGNSDSTINIRQRPIGSVYRVIVPVVLDSTGSTVSQDQTYIQLAPKTDLKAIATVTANNMIVTIRYHLWLFPA